jgi:hypothetical protein
VRRRSQQGRLPLDGLDGSQDVLAHRGIAPPCGQIGEEREGTLDRDDPLDDVAGLLQLFPEVLGAVEDDVVK